MCMWKVVFNCLSVDEHVRHLEIPLVSYCNCCLGGHIENLEHVQGNGEFAMAVWKKVSAELGIPFFPQQSWEERVQV